MSLGTPMSARISKLCMALRTGSASSPGRASHFCRAPDSSPRLRILILPADSVDGAGFLVRLLAMCLDMSLSCGTSDSPKYL